MSNWKTTFPVVAELVHAALKAADPAEAVASVLSREDTPGGGSIIINNRRLYQAGKYGRLVLISCGKAAIPMAQAAAKTAGDLITNGVVVTKIGQTGQVDHPAIRLYYAAHPVADHSSVTAAEAVLSAVEGLGPGDVVLCLISGGASALISKPLIPLDEWQQLTDLLLASGTPIEEINTVRHHLDRIKGGGLLKAASPAQVYTLILSDVVGNPLDKIGSGPTVPATTAREQAAAILKKVGASVPDILIGPGQSKVETSAFNEPIIIGDVRLAGEAARQTAARLGYTSDLLTWHLIGEAREIGRFAAALARSAAPGRCLILGGESTVTLRGSGIGGRNLEIALAAAITLQGENNVLVATLATDGDDGPTGAAGGIVDGQSFDKVIQQGGDPAGLLAENASLHFFEKYLPDQLIITGQTGTNVNDLVFILKMRS